MDEMEYGPDILTLQDEDGNDHEFEVLDSLEEDTNRYLALLPVLDDPQEAVEDDGELVILKVIGEDDEEYLEAIEDEDEFDRIADIFMKRLEDYYEFKE